MTRTADPNLRITILQAARAVFHQKGYTNARITDIAKRANVAVGTIYLYFWSKEALAIALIDDFYRRLLEEAIPLLGQGDFAQAIADTMHATLKIIYEHRDLLAMVYLQMGLTAFTERNAIEVQVSETLTAILQERMKSTETYHYDPEKAAQLIIGLAERTAVANRGESETRMELLEETLVRFIQHALILGHREQ